MHLSRCYRQRLKPNNNHHSYQMTKQSQLIQGVSDSTINSLLGLQDVVGAEISAITPLKLAIYFKRCEDGVKSLFGNILKDANYEFVKWAETHPTIKTLELDNAKLTSSSPPRKYMYSEATQALQEELKIRKEEEEESGIAVLLPIDENKIYQVFKITLVDEEEA